MVVVGTRNSGSEHGGYQSPPCVSTTPFPSLIVLRLFLRPEKCSCGSPGKSTAETRALMRSLSRTTPGFRSRCDNGRRGEGSFSISVQVFRNGRRNGGRKGCSYSNCYLERARRYWRELGYFDIYCLFLFFFVSD